MKERFGKRFDNFHKVFYFMGLLIVLLAHATINAQVAGGLIAGRVTDNSGAVIPGAQVVIRNTGTGFTTNLLTNEEGVYRAPNLLPGQYEISASAQSFAKSMQTGVTLTVGGELTIDLRLNPGGVGESVNVTSEAPQVDTATPTLGAVVAAQTIVELPLNGRDWTTLATLQPGISSIRPQAPSGSTTARGNRGYGDELTVAGHRPQENNYRIDGVSINDYSNGAPGSAGGLNLGADAIAEFSVLSSNYTAEYGRTSGGVINAITRSGTNSFHGSAYEFLRNDALDARNFFDRAKPPLRRNQFGASAGGPLVKNKTFYFGDYEGIRRSQGITSTTTVPSEAARQGRLSTGTVTVDPTVARYLNFWPLPNGGLLGAGDTGRYITITSQTLTEDFFTTRIDHRFSDRDSLFGTYFFDDASFNVPDVLNNTVFGNLTRRQMVAIEETHTFSPTLVNSIRLGYNRTKGFVNAPGEALNPIAGDTALGGAPGKPSPIISVPGLTATVAVGGNAIFRHIQNSYQLYDDAFLTQGNHSLRFGFAFEKIEYNELGLRRPNGFAAFGSLSDFLTNRLTSFFALDPTRSQEVGLRSSIVAGYVNDSWRATPKLNLTFGVRYEMSTIPTEHHDRLTAVRNLNSIGRVENVKSYFTSNPTLRNFEPRVGFAWNPFGDGKTAVRGGFGIYDALPLPWIFTPKAAQGTPFNVGTTVRNLAQGAFPKAAFNGINFSTTVGESVYVEPDPARSYIMNWNLTLQRQLGDWALTAAYVGSRGVHNAFVTDDANIVLPTQTPQGLLWPTPRGSGTRRVPAAGTLRANWWDGDSYYHGLHLQASKSLSRGLQAQASYTWSKAIDTGSGASRNDQFQNGITTPLQFAHRRAVADFHLGHSFVFNTLWLIPGPKKGLASALFGDWQIGAILSASSGVPFTVMIGGDPLGHNGLDPNGFPNRVGSKECEKPVNPGNPASYIKTECFTAPNPLTLLGNSGRNIAFGPGLINLDIAVYKNISLSRIAEGFKAQFRVEFFNLPNHTNFAAPLANNAVFNQSGARVANAGLITSTQTTSRQIQLGLRLTW
jgi:hypothetical protein